MKNLSCNCGATVFFENNQCVACGSELGWCPACDTLRSIHADPSGQYFCSEPSCGKALSKCHNYTVDEVCNRCCLSDSVPTNEQPFCDYCRFNDTIPDLSIAGNLELWKRIEIAKRRLLYTLDLLQAPYGHSSDGCALPLSFDFKADPVKKRLLWFNINKEEQVYTGHADGKVTINIREADHVEREKARVSFDEAHRTIIGHFRHEIGHYFWDVLVKGKFEQECIGFFGDHNNPDYSTALEQYYEYGPGPDWKQKYISAYATMHPWEDFAESFAAYLGIISVVDIAWHSSLESTVEPLGANFEELVKKYTQLGLLLNEMSRTMGLIDLVPVVYTPTILGKIEFIHHLLRNAGGRQ